MCTSKNKHPTTIAPPGGFTVQIQAMRATCGVICVSLQLCILTVTLSTETGGESTVYSWVKSLGAMPEQWKGRFWWPEVADNAWYDHTKTVSNPERHLAARIAKMRPVTSQAERELVLSVMLKVFCYLPERRITAEQLLQNPWFRALMEIYQC